MATGDPVKPDWQKELEKEIPKKPIVYTSENGGTSDNGNEWLSKALEWIANKTWKAINDSFAKNDYQGSVNFDSSDSNYATAYPEIGKYKRIIYLTVTGYRSQYIATNLNIRAYTKWYFSRNTVRFSSDYSALNLGDPNKVKDFFSNVSDSPDVFYAMYNAISNRQDNTTINQKRDYLALLETALHFGKNSKKWVESTRLLNGGTLPTGTGTTGTGTTGTGTGTGTTGTGSAGSESSTGANVALIGLGLFAVGLLLSNTEKPKNN